MSDTEVHYQTDSPVGKNKERVTNLVDNHWAYMESVLLAGIDVTREWDFDEVMEMRQWDYTSAMIHGYGHGVEDTLAKNQGSSFESCVQRQKDFALTAFGSGDKALGLIEHIRKECKEVLEDPSDTEEWVDIIVLAMEGAWRTGASPAEVAQIFDLKMSKNERRKWPAIGSVPSNQAIEHITVNQPYDNRYTTNAADLIVAGQEGIGRVHQAINDHPFVARVNEDVKLAGSEDQLSPLTPFGRLGM